MLRGWVSEGHGGVRVRTIEVNAFDEDIVVLGAPPALIHVDVVVESRVVDGQLVGVDADDGAWGALALAAVPD